MEALDTAKTTILIVDPDEADRSDVRAAFEGSGYRLVEAPGTESAFELLGSEDVDLILCELVLPETSGFAFCRSLREHPEHRGIPLVLISRWAGERDRILAFEVGADDFAAKPFFGRELAARVRAVLRRCAADREAPPEERPVIGQQDAFEVRADANEIRLDGRVVPLTRREFALVVALMRRRGRVVGREELISRAWGDLEAPHARSVDAHIKSIRRKLGQAGLAIETIRGLGYRFTDEPIRLGGEAPAPRPATRPAAIAGEP